MAKDDDTHESFKDSGVGIGANAEGKVEVFPLSELPARIAKRDEEERAWDAAMHEGDEDLDDVSDLELDALLEQPPS